MRYVLYAESRFKKQNRDALHELYRVNLIPKERLLTPHAPHHEILVLEKNWENADHQVNASFQRLLVSFFSDNLVKCGDIMHDFDYL
jgi:hydroxymethylpyrimidine/phosphomethylpyrimidine kinase